MVTRFQFRILLSIVSVLTVLVVGSPSAMADFFISGTATTNSQLAGGTGPENNVKRINLAGGGAVYTNFFGTGAGGTPVVGDRVIAAGVIPVTSALSGPFNLSFNTGNDLVLVAALQGQVVAGPGMGVFTSDFDPVSGGFSSVIGIYERTGAGAFSPNLPGTWVNDTGNLNDGLIGVLTLAPKADEFPFYVQGPPGGIVTDILNVVDPSLVNTATADPLTANAIFDTELKVDATFAAPFGTDFNVIPFSPDLVFEEFTLQAVLNETVQTASQLPLLDLAALEAIVTGFLGTGFTDGTLGGSYDPANVGTTFDFPSGVSGGAAIPGAQFSTQNGFEVPEPTSVAIWSLMSLAGFGYGWRKRRQHARKELA